MSSELTMIPIKQTAGVPKQSEDRCTFVVVNAVLKYFGKPPISVEDCPITGSEVMDVFRNNGLKIKVEWEWELKSPQGRKWLRYVMEHHTKGVYYLFTIKGPGHAMALIDGELVDTAEGSDRRSVAVARVYI